MSGDKQTSVDLAIRSDETSHHRPETLSLTGEARREFNQIIFRFEDAWQHEDPPAIEDYLPASGPLRLGILRELVRIDFEYRSVQGVPVAAAAYLDRFPELKADDEDLQSLMNWFSQFSIKDQEDSFGEVERSLASKSWSSIIPGTVLGNYTILELIGRGGMGAVFKARHQHMNRIVALKTISPAAMRSAEAVKRFHREVRAAARLDHPNIITAHDADRFGDVHVLIMQYVDGRDLASLVRSQGPLTVDEAVDYIAQAARGLEYAHRLGVIHRDIKPANLILGQDGQLKILDMGLARIAGITTEDRDDIHELTMTGEVVGTADFMAPEQAFDAKSAGCQADIYSLGCTLFYLLTAGSMFGKGSFPKQVIAHRESPIPRLQEARPDVPEWLEAVFQRMVAKKPEDRIQTMSELLAALSAGKNLPLKTDPVASESETFLSQSATKSDALNPHPLPGWAGRSRPWNRQVIAAAIAALVLVTVVVVVIRRVSRTSSSEEPILKTKIDEPKESVASDVGNSGTIPAPTISAASIPLTLTPISVTDIAADSRYSLLVSNGILLSPDIAMFDESERQAIQAFQTARGKSTSGSTQFFAGRFDVPSGWSGSRIQNVSPEACLTAWIVLREGQQPERLDAALDARDATIDPRGATSIGLFVMAFAGSESAAEYLGTKGLACKVLPIEN